MNLNKRQIILFIAAIVGLLTFLNFILNFSDIRREYHMISVLPLVYGVLSLLLSFSLNLSFLKVVIMLCYSIKLVFIPLLISLAGFQMFYGHADMRLNGYIFNAVILQCIEILSVTIFVWFLKDKSIKSLNNSFNVSLRPSTNKLLLLLFGVSGGLLILYPQFIYNYQPILMSDPEQLKVWTILSSTAKDTIPTYIYYLGGWCIAISKLLVPYYLIVRLYNGKQSKIWLKIILSIIIIMISCFFTSSARAATIFSAIIGILLLQKIYIKQSASIMRILLIGGSLGIFVIFFYETISNSSNVAVSLLYKLNAYFSGIFNVAGSFLMDDSDKFNYLVGDCFRSIPLVKGFFTGLPMSYLEFNRAIGIDAEYNSQILPAISQGYFYLGYLGTIVIPLMMIKIAFYLFNRMQSTSDSFAFFALGMTFIYILLGVYLYDMFLSFSLIINNAFLMLVIMKLSQFKIKI